MQRLSPGTLILGIFAILFGLVAAYAAKNYMQEKEKEVQAAETQQVEMISVPMAVADLPAGRVVTKEDIMVMRLTAKQVDELKIPGPYLDKWTEIRGRTLRGPIARGEVFQITSLYPTGLGPSVAERLAPGQRAVTVPFTGSAAQSGLISPGAIVDVLFRTRSSGRQGLPETTVTLLEKVTVLAVGKETFEGSVGGSGASGTVTLAVTALQARALKVVEDRGSLTLVLRSADDAQMAGTAAPTTLPELLGVKKSNSFETEIYRRGRRTTVIHGDGRPKYIHDAPYGMPIAEQARPSAADQGAMQTSASTSLAATSNQWTAEATGNNGHATGSQPASTDRAAVGQ